MHIDQTSTFRRNVKKLLAKEKKIVDGWVKSLMVHPMQGEMKVGDLAGVRVVKFLLKKKLTLLAYTYDETNETMVLLAMGIHENFYRDLKR